MQVREQFDYPVTLKKQFVWLTKCTVHLLCTYPYAFCGAGTVMFIHFFVARFTTTGPINSYTHDQQ